jgi:hypothetical protein
MLLSLAWSEVWSSFWIAVVAVIGPVTAFHFLGLLPASLDELSGFGLTVMGFLILVLFAVGAFVNSSALFLAHITLTEEELPETFRPQIERAERPWAKRMSVRHIEVLKGQLAATEDRIDLLATLDGHIRHHRELARRSADDLNGRSIRMKAQRLEDARARFARKWAGDDWRAAQIIERIDALHAGDVTAEIRGLEEGIEALQHERENLRSGDFFFQSDLTRISTGIRASERDIAELKSWQASRTKSEVKGPQWERFEHAKIVEYDNERIQIWARHAKFKAYEEQLAMRRDEIEKIERRVARGELTRREAEYLLRKLDEYFGEQDDRIFA